MRLNSEALEAAWAYSDDAALEGRPLGDGDVNLTYRIDSADRGPFVLQALNGVFDQRLIKDTSVVAEQLHAAGWEAPRVLPATDGVLWHRDAASTLWRASTFIDCDTVDIATIGLGQLRDCGELLGTFHGSLAAIAYEPTFKLPHFHDTQFHADTLAACQENLPDDETKQMANTLLQAFDELDTLPTVRTQLIHGDPRLDNILFKDGKPLTIIDLDTIMTSSPLIDLGDMMRSIMEADIKAGRPLDLTPLLAITRGYYEQTTDQAGTAECCDAVRLATQRVALELAMRFMNDIVADSYFAWDQQRFTSRRDNHMNRISQQYAIYKFLQDSR